MTERILSIDPSGTGTTGIFFTDGKSEEFQECKSPNWKEHYNSISLLVKYYKPTILLFETTNFVSLRGKDMTSLFKLLGSLEVMEIKKVASINVLKVKELTKLLLKGKIKIDNLAYQKGRGKGWMFNSQRVNIHQLEAFIVYWLWKNNNHDNQNNKSKIHRKGS